MKAFQGLRNSVGGKWFLFAVFMGVLSGIAAVAFQSLTAAIQHFTLGAFAGFQPPEPIGEHTFFEPLEMSLSVWLILPVITLGGLASGLLVYFFAPEAAGHGTDGAIDGFHNKRGIIPLRIPLIKTIASAITLGTGGSAGREGPIAQIGAGFGSYLAQRMNLSAHDRRIMLAIGMGAGIGAIFRAPLAGALFAGEILYRDADIEAEVIIPGAIASTIAYSIFQLSLPPALRFTPLFGDSVQYEVGHVFELLPYSVLALALVAAAILFVVVLQWTHKLFQRIPIIPHLKPMLGAFLAGILVIGSFFLMNRNEQALAGLGTGYGFLQDALQGSESLAIGLLFVVALTKIIATSLTIGSGGSGGVFGPAMVIGGSLGAGVGKLLHQLFPSIVTQPSAFTIVGMAGFFAGCANAPFSTILMVTEMTGDYKLLVPTLWVSSICFIVCRRWSLYDRQVDTRLDSPAHRGDFVVDLLEGLLVKDIYRPRKTYMSFYEDATLDEIVHSLADTSQRYFPVLDPDEKLVGIFSVEDVRAYLYDDVIWKVVNAGDIMIENIVTVSPDDGLDFALNQFTALNVDELPVVSLDNANKIIGVLRRKETIAAYNKRRLELKKQQQDENN